MTVIQIAGSVAGVECIKVNLVTSKFGNWKGNFGVFFGGVILFLPLPDFDLEEAVALPSSEDFVDFPLRCDFLEVSSVSSYLIKVCPK